MSKAFSLKGTSVNLIKPNRIRRHPLIANPSFKICVTHNNDEGNIKNGNAEMTAKLFPTPNRQIIPTIQIVPIEWSIAKKGINTNGSYMPVKAYTAETKPIIPKPRGLSSQADQPNSLISLANCTPLKW